MAAIEANEITVRFGEKTVLDRFCICVPDEGLTWLSGPSGEGKTTLLRVLSGLLIPQAGTVHLSGRPVMLFQENRLFPGLSVQGQVEAVLPRPRRTEAHKWLAFVEMDDAAELRPEMLSGGMARRCALARALAVEGEILLLDEPFAGVDLSRAERILARLRKLGRPVLLSGHAPELARLCDRMIMLSGGW